MSWENPKVDWRAADVVAPSHFNSIGNNLNFLWDWLDTHTKNKSNPHSVTKDQVALGSVMNYGIATQAQAKAGSVNDKYMTPLRTREAIDEFLIYR